MENWGAMEKWSLQYFRSLAPKATAHIEQGNIFQGDTDFTKLQFADYADAILEGRERDENGKVRYFAYFDIFELFPEAEADVDFSLLTQFTVRDYRAGWIGPGGTMTGYHFDWPDNLLAQVVGSKEIRLVSPQQSERMYPTRKFDYLTRQSAIDVESYDASQHPRFQDVEEHRITLKAGEMLFLPRHWWHCVKSLEQSISVNSFGYTPLGALRDGLPELTRLLLHRGGLYQRNNCCCHMSRDGRRVAK